MQPNDNRHLIDQVNRYLADVNGSVSPDALHVVFIGGNDVAEAVQVYILPSQADAALVIQNAVASVSFNVVPPAFAQFQPGASVLGGGLADAYNVGLQDPESYGLTNTTDRCVRAFVPPYRCDRPERYVYWDNFHPTARVHKIIGEAAIAVMMP